MGEKDTKEKTCTCENSLEHYVIVFGGSLRIGSIVLGLIFSAGATDIKGPEAQTLKTLDKVIAVIEEITDKITE